MKLIEFIKSNDNWEEILSNEPYCIKISRDNGFIIFKYNQISSDFSYDIVCECRGIILKESTLEVVCFPFTKFFNIDEEYACKIDWSNSQVQEKVDGSLIKVWFCDGNWHISTNGTIDAFKAELPNNLSEYKTFGELFSSVFDLSVMSGVLDKDCTYMFELVSPYNKVVVSYPTTKIYHIGTRNNKTYKELSCDIGIEKSKVFSLKTEADVRKAASELPFNEEGYVVVDSLYNRVKVKSPLYVSASRLIGNGNMSFKKALELILMNEQSEFLSYFPEYQENFNKISGYLEKYKENLMKIMENLRNLREKISEKKEFALKIKEKYPLDTDFCFKIWDNKISSIDEYIDRQRVESIIERIKLYET